MIRLGIVGAAGRMGRMIAEVVREQPELELTCSLDQGDAVERATSSCDVVIDFSAPEATAQLVPSAAEHGCALVIGTTGLDARTDEAIARAATRVPVMRSANMSLGVNLLLGLVERTARALGDAFDVELVEWHHRQKKDAPSGTALALARAAADALGRDLATVGRYGREGQPGARSPDEIGVLAVRGGDIVGEHTVFFCGLGERLELTHRASSRETFARGAVRAATWVHGRAPGLYDMRDVLGLR
jgi:4-hydroxy-tetrahydrodipicolinate reductase